MNLPADFALMIAWSTPGAFLRILLGAYKVYITHGYIKLDWRRVLLELLSAVTFGTFAAVLLNDLGFIRPGSILGPIGVALLGGFFGADLLNRLAMIVGVPQGITVAIERLPHDLNPRQQKALEYAGKYRSINNDQYQSINYVKDSVASRELNGMVKKGWLKQVGKGKAIRYEF